jgi:hypothetical protein
MVLVRQAGPDDVAACVDVLRELPDFFTADTHQAFAEQFVQVDTIDPLPGWAPGNPSAIYVASLVVTVDIGGGAG